MLTLKEISHLIARVSMIIATHLQPAPLETIVPSLPAIQIMILLTKQNVLFGSNVIAMALAAVLLRSAHIT
jgi:hypothetical protein